MVTRQPETGFAVTARLAGDSEGPAREVVVEGLAGSMRVAELLARAAAVLAVPATVATRMLMADSRLLRGEDTLAEAGVREGGTVEVWLGEGGGMPGRCFGLGGQQQLVDDLRARVREAEAQARAEATRHAEAEARLKEALRKLEAEQSHSSAAHPAFLGTGGRARVAVEEAVTTGAMPRNAMVSPDALLAGRGDKGLVVSVDSKVCVSFSFVTLCVCVFMFWCLFVCERLSFF